MHLSKYLLMASLATLALPAAAGAATSPLLGTSDSFAVLAADGVTNTGATTINGDIGSFPLTTVETATMTITGTNHQGDGVTQGAKTDLTTAYLNAEAQGTDFPIVADLGGQTLVPGVYNSAISIGLTGTVTLNGGGNADAVFIFQAGSTLTTASASNVVLTGGTQACNVFWQIGSDTTLGTNSVFRGTILGANDISITTGVTIFGRALSRDGAVTLDNDTISKPSCAAPATQAVVAPTAPTPTDTTPTPADTTVADAAAAAQAAAARADAKARADAVTAAARAQAVRKAAAAKRAAARKRAAAARKASSRKRAAAARRRAAQRQARADDSSTGFARRPGGSVGITG